MPRSHRPTTLARVLACCLTFMIIWPAFALADTARFEIRSEPLSTALKAFAEQAHMQLLYEYAIVQNVQGNSVIGVIDKHAALNDLLRNTGLEAVFSANDAATIKPTATHARSHVQRNTTSERSQLERSESKQADPAAGRTDPAVFKTEQNRTIPERQTAPEATLNVIMVTARKKRESDLDVPIAMSILGKTQLSRYNISSLQDVAAVTPDLKVSTNFGSQGGNITLRGIGTPPLNAAAEQAVAIDLDGVTVSNGNAVRFAQFDLAQVTVLKGPQSLYYGKNTVAGVIAIRSADPTNKPYAMVRVGYQFESDDFITEGVISGPLLGHELTGRLAYYRSDMQGYLHNPISSTNVVPPASEIAFYGPMLRPKFSRAPNSVDNGVRGTLKFQPSDRLKALVKTTYTKQSGSASNQASLLFYCPAGVPAPGNPGNVPGIGVCGLGRYSAPLGQNPTSQVGQSPLYRDGQPYQELTQYLISANVTAKLTDDLTLNSVTGYYHLHLLDSANATFSPYPGLGSANDIRKHDFSEEIRLSSDFSGPVNGFLGVFYDKGGYYQHIPVTILQGVVPGAIYNIPSRTYSAYANVTYEVLDRKLHFSLGGRYTNEKKDLSLYSAALNAYATNLGVSSFTSNQFNPEITVTWHPSSRTTVYGSYKWGTQSGGFNSDTLVFPPFAGRDFSYKDEKVSGFEGGIKTLMLGGALRLNFDGYTYLYKNLQVGVIDPVTAAELLENAGRARVSGVEASARFSPRSIRGFNISGSVNYNRARYLEYLSVCYTGQTIAEGCNLNSGGNIVANGGVLQNFAGRPLTDAPDWSGNLTANYDFPVSSNGTGVGITLGAVYTSSYYPIGDEPPNSLQRSYVTLDANLRLFNEDRGWEVAVIGTNLTDQHRIQLGVETPFTPGVAAGTGTPGPGVKSDLVGFENAPYELLVRFTIEPLLFFRKH